jgi:hypothetical protein
MDHYQSTAPTGLCDFNMAGDDGTVTVLRVNIDGLTPKLGGRIVLCDADENECDGVVAFLDATYLDARPVWETWRGFETRRIAGIQPATTVVRPRLVARVA